MLKEWLPPAGLIYLSLHKEALPLLKKGVIPLRNGGNIDLPWLLGTGENAPENQIFISDKDYQEHLQQEYRRLPANLQRLLTLEVFMRQAEVKRTDIEAALLAKRQDLTRKTAGCAEDWFVQRFFSNPYSVLAWQQRGFSSIWLGIDASQWPQALLHPVRYRDSLPLEWHERFTCDLPELSLLHEKRLLLARTQAVSQLEVAGELQALVRLPPKALRSVLLGAQVAPDYSARFWAYWRQDFRYQRIPVAQMRMNSAGRWQFYPL
ncbi:MAG: hypothetical protein RL217_243 [Pseudomonadota bacterium]|jgi:hypothetical protein